MVSFSNLLWHVLWSQCHEFFCWTRLLQPWSRSISTWFLKISKITGQLAICLQLWLCHSELDHSKDAIVFLFRIQMAQWKQPESTMTSSKAALSTETTARFNKTRTKLSWKSRLKKVTLPKELEALCWTSARKTNLAKNNDSKTLISTKTKWSISRMLKQVMRRRLAWTRSTGNKWGKCRISGKSGNKKIHFA